MNLAIFGATGSIGRLLVARALAAGHTVTAFTRQAAPDLPASPALSIATGDVRDGAAVGAAIAGQEAVLVALGAGRRGGVRGPGTAAIVAAMQRHGVRRLVCQTTLGVGDSAGNLNFFWKYLMFGLLLRAAFRDHEEQEAHVRASGLDWTIVRPAAFTDGPARGPVRHGFGPAEPGLRLTVPRAEVAAFMLAELTARRYLHAAPGLSE